MPWINENECSGCELCVKSCPAEAIAVRAERKAFIDMGKCLRCGVCHNVCPLNAVRHDSELVPGMITSNIEDASKKIELCATLLGNPSEREKSLERFIKHYQREISVAKKTIEGLEKLKKNSPGRS